MTPDIHKEVCDPKNIVGWIIGDDPSPQEIEAVIRHALTTEAARVRGETWREAIQLARFGAMELRDMNEDLRPDWLGYGPAALQDFADQLEEKAKQADHLNDAVEKVSPWSAVRPTVAGWYWWRLDKEFPLEVACVRINGLGSAYELLDNGSRNELPDGGEWCPIARPVEREG